VTMNIALTTICVKARSDRAPMYYVRPLLDIIESHVEYTRQQSESLTSTPLMIWSYGYIKNLLKSLGVNTLDFNPELIGRQCFEGDRWLHDKGFFISPNAIEAREPLLYAVWLAKAYVIHTLLSREDIDAAVWLDCAYRVSYRHNHNIDEYIRYGKRMPNIARFVDTVRAWLKSSPVVLAGSRIPPDIRIDDIACVRPLAGCFIAVRKDYRDEVWNSLLKIHHELVHRKQLSTDEAMWALACKTTALVRNVDEWDIALYG